MPSPLDGLRADAADAHQPLMAGGRAATSPSEASKNFHDLLKMILRHFAVEAL
jgi:hypothetical protein